MTTIHSVLLLLVCALARAQNTDKVLTFDVASVKAVALTQTAGRIVMPKPPPPVGAGGQAQDLSRIRYPLISVKSLLLIAYDVNPYQVIGPDWLDTELIALEATMTPGTTKEQSHVMLQNLLSERFKMSIHREMRDSTVYSLVVGKNGPKLKESAETAAPPDADAAPLPPTCKSREIVPARPFKRAPWITWPGP